MKLCMFGLQLAMVEEVGGVWNELKGVWNEPKLATPIYRWIGDEFSIFWSSNHKKMAKSMASWCDACVAHVYQSKGANEANGRLVSSTHTTLGSSFQKSCLPAGTGSVPIRRQTVQPYYRTTTGRGSSTRISLSDSWRAENTINTHKYTLAYYTFH
jgi:hypothetical protein